MKLYKQCRLKRGNQEMVSWIETRGAIKGVEVSIPDEGGFWTVMEVYNPAIKENVLREKQRMDRNSLPSIRT